MRTASASAPLTRTAPGRGSAAATESAFAASTITPLARDTRVVTADQNRDRRRPGGSGCSGTGKKEGPSIPALTSVERAGTVEADLRARGRHVFGLDVLAEDEPVR